jgi:hypothetical protein
MMHPAVAEDSALIQELISLSSTKSKLVRSTKYAAPADPNVSITSWKMAEHKYYVVPSPFPTLARGVFSVRQPDGEQRIVARGYDKFFNIGEVGWTTVRLRLPSVLFPVTDAWMEVASTGGAHDSAVHPLAEKQWVYHFYCGADPGEAAHHLQARCGAVEGRDEAQPRGRG